MEVGLVTTGDPDAAVMASAERAADAVETLSADSLRGASPDLFLVPTIDALRSLVTTDPDGPVLVVDGPEALGAVGPHAVGDAIAAIRDGDATERMHATLHVEGNGTESIAIEEAMAMTGEPASISEYAIRHGDVTIARYRADGVVTATPVGSGTYTRSAGGPILEPELTAMAVVPIAPYRTDPDQWVLDGAVEIEVLRDVGDVGLYVDGEHRGDLSKGDRLSCTLGPTYRTRSPRGGLAS